MNLREKIFLWQDLLRQVRLRLPFYAFVIFGTWPLFSAAIAAIELKGLPYYSISWTMAVGASLAGMLILLPDFLAVGGFTMIISLSIFSILAMRKYLRVLRFHRIIELVLLFLSLLFGSVLYYPAVLSNLALASLYSFPVWIVMILPGGMLILGSCFLAMPGSRLRVFLSIVVIGLLIPIPVAMKGFQNGRAVGEAPLVLLGVDSLSHRDNLSFLKEWSEKNKGTWYSRAVPPGLLTNAVWTSIITMRPVHDHGVFHLFQHFPILQERETLAQKAKRAGYWTVSVFPEPDWLGSDAGFDEDRSGPLAWRQLATSSIENASLFLPLLRPLLPKLPFSTVPPNHSATFTYDVDRELDQIFSARSPGGSSFVAAHLMYLHAPRFPGFWELTWKECWSVLSAKVSSIRDRDFDWQAVDRLTDPISVHEWKVQRVQKSIAHSIERTKFFERGGRLLLFSDHGHRAEMTIDSFWQERYHHVLLVTFGLRTRDPEAPISLLDAGSLLDLAPNSPIHDPVVEFTLSNPSEWFTMAKSARLHWKGSIELDEKLLATIFRRLRSYRPWPQEIPPRIYLVFPRLE